VTSPSIKHAKVPLYYSFAVLKFVIGLSLAISVDANDHWRVSKKKIGVAQIILGHPRDTVIPTFKITYFSSINTYAHPYLRVA